MLLPLFGAFWFWKGSSFFRHTLRTVSVTNISPLDVTLFACAGCIYIFISQASPSQDALGKTYGLGQTLHSIVGAIAPATATSIIAVSLQHNLLGGALGYLILASVGVVALGLTSLMPAAGRVKPVNTNIELELE